ncbi:MAG: glycosyltransferase [Clostridia bacterium]|nr:glycosyltransferase [Clostridia bacterium]
MKISIIVPVYKTEKYLDKCIESILNQTFKDFELILVDDGSPDNCGKICDEWAKKDDRIVVIHKENGGVSSARNTALNNIKGEYVGFVDSDDTIEPTMYEKLYNNLIDSNAQISVCDFKFITPSGVQENKSEIKTEIYDSSVALEVVLKGKPFAGHLCNKLFKAELFENVRLDEDIYIFEDMLAVLRILFNPIKIVYFSEPLYNYYLHENSAFHSKLTERYMNSSHKACQKMRELVLEKDKKALVSTVDAKTINSDLGMLSKIAGDKEAQKKYSKNIIKNLKKHLNLRSFKKLRYRAKAKALVASICPRLYLKIMSRKQGKAH